MNLNDESISRWWNNWRMLCEWKLGTGGSGASFRYQRTRIASNCCWGIARPNKLWWKDVFQSSQIRLAGLVTSTHSWTVCFFQRDFLQDEVRVARGLIGERESDLQAVRSVNDQASSYFCNVIAIDFRVLQRVVQCHSRIIRCFVIFDIEIISSCWHRCFDFELSLILWLDASM